MNADKAIDPKLKVCYFLNALKFIYYKEKRLFTLEGRGRIE